MPRSQIETIAAPSMDQIHLLEAEARRLRAAAFRRFVKGVFGGRTA